MGFDGYKKTKQYFKQRVNNKKNKDYLSDLEQQIIAGVVQEWKINHSFIRIINIKIHKQNKKKDEHDFPNQFNGYSQ